LGYLSDLAIQTNSRDAPKKLGAQILYANGGTTTARLEDKGQTIQIKVESRSSDSDVSLIEEKSFEPCIQPPKADAMKAATISM